MNKKDLTKGLKGLILVFTLLIIVPFVQGNEIIIEEKDYFIGDVVNFEIISDEEERVEIKFKEDTYRLLGRTVGTHSFTPNEPGVYELILNSEEIVSKTFEVKEKEKIQQNNVLNTDKKEYYLGEKVSVKIEDVNVQRLEVKKEGSTFVFMGEIKSPMTFYPDSPGKYEIILKDIHGETYITSFEVSERRQLVMNIPSKASDSKPFKVVDSSLRNRAVEIEVKDSPNTGFGVQSLNNKKDVDVNLLTGHVKKVNVKGLEINEDTELGVDDIPLSKNINFNKNSRVKSFAVEVKGDFDSKTFTSVARGNELYECNSWNFEESICEGTWDKIKDLKPGNEYEFTSSSTSSGYAETGVATVNTKKPIYKPGETAEFLMVVLDRDGYLVSNAEVELEIINPDDNLTIQNEEITMLEPGIYYSTFNNTEVEGKYSLKVTAVGRNVNHSLESYFVVKEEYAFDIIRDTPVTIDPWQGPFNSSIKITSYEYSGSFSFTEVIPEHFTLYDVGGASVSSDGSYTLLTWEGLENNSVVSYTANSPLVTPDLYELGPSFITYEDEMFFEARPWYLAIDPINYYDPTSTILDGWSIGTGITHTEINSGVRQPNSPSTNSYVASEQRAGEVSEFGFPSVTETDVEEITLWVYAGTGGNVEFTFELWQNGDAVCSQLVPLGSNNQWFSCTWIEPTGSLDSLSVYLDEALRADGGKATDAIVYAAYIEVDTGFPPPDVGLISPADEAVVENSVVNFSFSVSDETFSVMDSCSLYGNFSGIWEVADTINDVDVDTTYTFSESLNDGVYEWNVECDNSDKTAFAEDNRTVTVNAVPPLFENAALNETLIRQNRSVRFNVSITDVFGISFASFDLEFPDSSVETYVLDNVGDEYFFVFTDTIEEGTYSVVEVFANDTLGQSNTINPGLTFEVQAIPPEPFSLLNPANNTESRELTPTMQWEETITPDFEKYELIMSKDSSFNTVDFTYETFSINQNSFTLTSALDANSVYYWKVIAYDVFGNERESNEVFTYINDRTAPTVELNAPGVNSFVTNSLVTFTYTPDDANTIDFCSLYGDFNGQWELLQTDNSITKGTTNEFTETVVEGSNVWNVECTDLATNSRFATNNFTVILDTTGPVVTLLDPVNNTEFNDTNFIDFSAEAFDDLASVDSCGLLINGSVVSSKSVDDNVPFSFNRFLINGLYEWSVSCVDVNGNSDVSESRLVLVNNSADVAPNVVLNSPLDGSYLMSGDVLFNYTVEDTFGVDFCELYIDDVLEDTDGSPVNLASNTFFVSGFSEDSYGWRVECVDSTPEANRGFSENFTFTVDLTDPLVSLESPLDNAEFSDSSVLFEYVPVDDNLDYCELYTDDNGGFQSRLTDTDVVSGVVNNFSYTVLDGVSVWNVECFDLSGRSSFAEFNRTIVVDTTPPSFQNIIINPESPVEYALREYNFNITWTDSSGVDTVFFEHNFTGTLVNETITEENGVYSFTIQDLDVGNYVYRWFANDTFGNENSTDQFDYVVEKAEPEIELTLNGLVDNVTINEFEQVNIVGTTLTPTNGFLQIFLEGQEITNGTSPLSTLETFNDPGTFNVTLVYPETQNYLSSQKTLFVMVLDITDPVVNLMSPSNDSLVGTGEVSLSYNVSDDSEIDICSLFINNNLEQTDNEVDRNIPQFFTVNLNIEDTYTWRVECTDEAGNTGFSETRTFTTVDTDAIVVDITVEEEYEVGEIVEANIKTTDIFENLLNTEVNVSLIHANTSVPWWNWDWSRRRPLTIEETTGSNQEDALVEINMTFDCDEIRIINHQLAQPSEILYNVHAQDNEWCVIAFEVNLSSNEVNEEYYVYYDNPLANPPVDFLDTTLSQSFFAGDANADEGTPTGVANIIGSNDDTAVTLTQGGGTGTHSAHGTNFVDIPPGSFVYDVQARFRYGVTEVAANTLWELRYSVDEGQEYTVVSSGVNTVPKTTSSWTTITNDYDNLIWGEVNNTRLQARIFKTGGGSNTMLLYWTELNITYSRPPDISQVSIENEEILINQTSGGTGSNGEFDWLFPSRNLDFDWYSLVATATVPSYTTSSGNASFEIIPDVTPPEVVLISPEDGLEGGRGNYDFTYFVSDINLDSCTLYLGTEGDFETVVTENNPLNEDNNTFENVFVDLGFYYWNVLCTDLFDNEAFASENYTLNVTGPDLVVNDIFITESLLVEGILIEVFANISNEGLSNTNDSFIVQFFKGDPEEGGVQINQDILVNELNISDSILVNTTYLLQAGNNDIFVVVDPEDNVGDADLSNNKGNETFVVELYQYHYGNVTTDLLAGDEEGRPIIEYKGLQNMSGHLFIAHSEASFSFENLQALTRNIDGNFVSGDFTNLDSVLNSTDFQDSIRTVWGDGTDNPIETMTFELTTGTIEGVPVVQSTNNENFKTGILWDTSDDTGNERFDASDAEDVVFVTMLNPNSVGKYGTYGYEIRVPALLRDYYESNSLSFYIEII